MKTTIIEKKRRVITKAQLLRDLNRTQRLLDSAYLRAATRAHDALQKLWIEELYKIQRPVQKAMHAISDVQYRMEEISQLTPTVNSGSPDGKKKKKGRK